MRAPDYAFYKGEYAGAALDESNFSRLILRAEERLAADTFGRCLEPLCAATDRKLQLCLCAMAEAIAEAEAGDDRLTGETLGSWKRTYAHSTGNGDNRVRQAERLYLADTGLLFRGRQGVTLC